MMIVGLTGGIGSGKTTVAKMFEALQVPIYVADERAKYLMENSETIHQELIQLFGKEVLDKKKLPNRKFIASKVFHDKKLLDQLNTIIHPRVAKDFNSWLLKQTSTYVIYEAAIIFEKNIQNRFDYVILVTAPKEQKIKRVLKRDNATEGEVKARMNNQLADIEKIKLANFVIDNTDLKVTKQHVLSLHHTLLSLVNT
ncbi:dephospho-CoA kinase [Mesonia aestuariivivens]|uniref:Dephospho-CoA kinase n=1 Tax=Mesonia aestuariivivens TaxID=2796128 RepID=A0ABS6W004_9FLAO|nr:dephospho-CoA kinase [Mesonia aestuariivivens]MBW2961182.1 dephospho-CoA kinase [Mesonia aestuariivivens]